jgi:archaeosine-15-forming tRNA-guanine transglycosylase
MIRKYLREREERQEEEVVVVGSEDVLVVAVGEQWDRVPPVEARTTGCAVEQRKEKTVGAKADADVLR